jgi:hypothetical protein
MGVDLFVEKNGVSIFLGRAHYYEPSADDIKEEISEIREKIIYKRGNEHYKHLKELFVDYEVAVGQLALRCLLDELVEDGWELVKQ